MTFAERILFKIQLSSPIERFAFIGWLALVIMGATQATNWSTDNYSDKFIFDEMLALISGRHRYGIVDNSHYPNGPGYILLPFMKMGFTELRQLRWIPFFVSIIGFTFLMLSILRSHLESNGKFGLLVLWYLLAFLPGFVYWQGALHEHSYAMTLSLAAIGVALWPRREGTLWLIACFTLGYLASWVGFDFLPVQLTGFFAVAFVANGGFLGLRSTVLQSATMFVGAILAILSHLLQNSFYFGTWSQAWNDLIGSASTYAGAGDAAKSMSPEYYNAIVASVAEKGHDTHLGSVVAGFTKSFLTTWSSPLWGIAFAVTFFTLPFVLITRPGSKAANVAAWLKNIAPAAVVAVFCCYSWVLLMPNHAVFHFHFLPRHFIVGLLALSIANVFAIKKVNS